MDITDMEDAILFAYKILTDEDLLDTPDFTEEQWAALCDEAPMTQEIFDACLDLCFATEKFQMFDHICERFPEFCPDSDV